MPATSSAHFTALGDGRAILLGEQITPGGERVDIQLKGAGQTRFSRRGDGRAALGPMLREYIISEAMHALGIPTTRSLAVVTTGEPVYRETVLDGRGADARRREPHPRRHHGVGGRASRPCSARRALADYTRAPALPRTGRTRPSPHFALFEAIVERQARLIARWQHVGFIHGVMNTDNMALSGETIDYGPCAFMDAYDPATVFSSIDHGGRYAYGNQPPIAQWNLARLAEAMLPLFDADTDRAVERATAALERFAAALRSTLVGRHARAKLGLFTEEADDRRSCSICSPGCSADPPTSPTPSARCRARPPSGRTRSPIPRFARVAQRWQARRARQPQSRDESSALMRRHNPAFIPRNHKVEEALEAATEGHDLAPMRALMDVLATPYDEVRDSEEFSAPGPPGPGYRTFCGT